MKKKTRKTVINDIGVIDILDLSVDAVGSFDIHFGFDDIGKDADKIIDNCMNQYKNKYPHIDTEKDVYWDFRLIYSVGIDNPEVSEFMAEVYIWQREDEDTCEFYDGFQLSLDEESKKAVKRIIWEKLGETLFNI